MEKEFLLWLYNEFENILKGKIQVSELTDAEKEHLLDELWDILN